MHQKEKRIGRVMLPVYRAKELDSNKYIEGFLFNYTQINTSGKTDVGLTPVNIDPSTLAIHFPHQNMYDKKGKKIFISLSRTGKGGDVTSETNQALTIHDMPIYGYDFETILIRD